ncbi:MAG: methylmalonyl-CoA mutase [bacterium]|nr:methylmalonyl-CoA mutase [bacterium]
MNESVTPDRDRLLTEFPVPDLDAWQQEVERLLKGAPFAKKMFTRTLAGFDVGPMATVADTADLPWPEHLPGQTPYLRGGDVAGSAPWLVAQELPLPTTAEFNAALKHDLQRGQTAVQLILDEACHHGLDPDQAPAEMVGRGGTSLVSLRELEQALDGVDLATTPLFVQSGRSSLAVATMLAVLVKRRGGRLEDLRGCLGGDPMAGFALAGKPSVSKEGVYDDLAVLTCWAAERAPKLRTLPVFEDPWHDGGADPALSLGLTLGSALAVLRAMEKRDVPLEQAAARVQFNLCVDGDFFMGMAKLRALRLLWSRVQAEAGLEPAPARIHVRTSRRTQTVLDPHVNMLRATTQAMAAVLGGADSLHVSPFDEVDSLPDEFGRRIARNVHLLLAHECRFDHVADPAGGSWFVEKLTADLAEAAWSRLQETERDGGVMAALRLGLVQERVAAVAEQRRRDLAVRRNVIIGTNQYANPREADRETRRVDHVDLHARRSAQVAGQRTGDDAGPAVLEQLGNMLESEPAELFACMEAAVDHGATLGELTSILGHEDTADPPVEPIPLRRDAAPFEELRSRLEVLRKLNPRAARVHGVCLGDVARYMPRLDFTRRFFESGGWEVLAEGFHEDAANSAAAAQAADAAACVLVGLDDSYVTMAVPTVEAIKALMPKVRILLAGAPGEREQELRDAGVDEFINLRSDALDVLGRLADHTEVNA